MATSAFTMKPSIIPNMRRVLALWNFFEARRMISAEAIAPTEAARATDRPPEGEMADIVAIAAPRDAPALTPIMWGSAKGFLKMLCIWVPDRARAAPARSAVATRGARSRRST